MPVTNIPLRFHPLPTTRICQTCGIEKPLNREHFYERIEKPLWLSGRWHRHCIACIRKRAAEYYQQNVEGNRETRRRQYGIRRQNLINLRHIPERVQRASAEARIGWRLEEIDRRHRRALVRDSMPKTGSKSFAQRAAEQRIQESAERFLRGQTGPGTHEDTSEPDDANDVFRDPFRQEELRIALNRKMSPEQKRAARETLEQRRKQYWTDNN
ncbi:hypothetical protein [Cupriavidus metallidurans]|jgi:hypothetical protein|uniref:hypothetical protein n=1 Tax=Cupriavidus metallidurans TaxID=119219 RepID=UPI0007637974|nr:hypothetical protein [Cupriavidus metallidurans]KWW33261.1 hypothetical protein AU374_05354 [Cupriavidus metallidurans]